MTCIMIRLPNYILALEATGRRNFAQKTKTLETHYEVLNVPNDCSQQEIRNAFLKLSKQYHPDVKNSAANVDRTARFVQITEAYQTLAKASTRRDYDDSLLWNPGGSGISGGSTREPIQPWDVKPQYNPNPGPYYGIKGLNRVSNWKVALFLMSLGILGAIFGFSSVKHSFHMSRAIQDEISAEANSHHATVVANAQKYGNEEQVRRMVERLARDPLGKAAAK